MIPLGITLWNISLFIKGMNIPIRLAIKAVSITAKTVETGMLTTAKRSRSVPFKGRGGKVGKKSRASLFTSFINSSSTFLSSPFWLMHLYPNTHLRGTNSNILPSLSCPSFGPIALCHQSPQREILRCMIPLGLSILSSCSSGVSSPSSSRI